VDKYGQLVDEYAVPEFKGLWQARHQNITAPL
jgi:hypothetical protein